MASPSSVDAIPPVVTLFSLREYFKDEDVHRVEDKRVRLQKIPTERITDIAVTVLLGIFAVGFLGSTVGGGYCFFHLNQPSWAMALRIFAFCALGGVAVALTVVFIIVTKMNRKNRENLKLEEAELVKQLYTPLEKEELTVWGWYLDPAKTPDNIKGQFSERLQNLWKVAT